MARPQALVYRGNTGNAGYGFEQVMGHGDGQANITGQKTGASLYPGLQLSVDNIKKPKSFVETR